MATVRSILLRGFTGQVIDIECRLSNNLPLIVIVGSTTRSVGEARERIRGAFASSRIMLPRKRITVNLAPADVPKADSGLDLAIAAAVLQADGQVDLAASEAAVFIGELGLDGRVRPVRGIIGKLIAGRNHGIRRFYIPAANLEQARLVPGLQLMPVGNLAQLYIHLTRGTSLKAAGRPERSRASRPQPAGSGIRLKDIAGQAQAKRALAIAAAGGHNVFFDGPPGTGKSMLAQALPGLLPPLETEEILEVTQLYSLAANDFERIVTSRPFRAPHHSASLSAMIGGAALRPGEISLAHRGVLFLDELPEFGRETLEALRQPLENRAITITRSHGSAGYPADFIFIATANPCPCGHGGTSRCGCSQAQINAYRNRLSGPILDRIDLHTRVHEVRHDQLLEPSAAAEDEGAIRDAILTARGIQRRRFGPARLNAGMSNDDIRRHADIETEAVGILNQATERLGLSARAYMGVIKVARTIADLEGAAQIGGTHLAEALQYRPDVSVRGRKM